MAKLMPGRVRNEGIALYHAGHVSLIGSEEDYYQFMVDGHEVNYDMGDRLTHCPCETFVSKGYCPHVAGVEYYLKHHTVDDVSEDIEDEQETTLRSEHVFGSRFLEELEPIEATDVCYQLSVSGDFQPYGNEILWTVSIRRLPDQRPYIVRDLVAFVDIITQEKYYQIGKNYYERLTRSAFDEASQGLIDYLNRLAGSDSQVFFRHNHRYVYLPGGFFEDGLTVFRQLSQFGLTMSLGQVPFVPTVRPLMAEDELYQFKVNVELDQIVLTISDQGCDSFYDDRYCYRDYVFYALDDQQRRLVKALKTVPLGANWSKVLTFDLSEQDRLAEQLVEFSRLGRVLAPKSFEIKEFTPSFELDIRGEYLYLTTQLAYDDRIIRDAVSLAQLPFSSQAKKLAALEKRVNKLGFPSLFDSTRALPSGADLYEFLENELPQLSQLGELTLSPAVQNLRRLERPSIYLERSGGLLEVNFDFSGLLPEDIEQALTSLRQQDPYFISRSGQVILFDDEVKRISQTLLTLRAKQVGTQGYQLSSLASFQVKDALADYDRATFSEELEQMTAHLAAPETFDLPSLPVTAGLRDYQKRGVQWLSVLDHYGFGGILADDMGLGKTLQTIAFLSPKLAEGKTALIVTPSSLIYNWQEEFTKFYPEADVCVVQGNKSQRDTFIAEQHQVSLTSYHSFRQDLDRYQSQHYDYLILDEAQALKNSQTKIAQALREFDVARCFALSGTPIENRLLEIWSIFQIVLPGLFDSKAQFNRLSAKEVAKTIQPFVLRRKKEDVLPELPEVTEITYHNEMSKDQKAIYLAQLERMKTRLSHVTESEFSRHKIEILSGITRLRQICDTPQLFMPFEGTSGKMDSLRDLLLQIKENGHRALIFSQFKTMLTLVESELSKLGLESYLLTGSTNPKDRQAMTTAFNKGSRDAFLMSLKAGGVGLNLTGADTVVLIDLWWNPAVEMQAIGRAHRLGQDKPVQVYRLITQGSIEEKILTMQEDKRHLMTDVLEGADTRANLSLEDIKQILGIDD